MKKVLITFILLIIGLFTFLYLWSYGDGFWSGRVLSVSHQGFIFKTYEGKLSIEAFGSLKGASPIAEVRDFSIESDNEEVLKDLQQVALTGERVNLMYKRKLVKFFWRGDTKYFVTAVERLGERPAPPATPQTP